MGAQTASYAAVAGRSPVFGPLPAASRRIAVIARAGKARATAPEGQLQSGMLVMFKKATGKEDRHVLALLLEPDGKKNWFVQLENVRRASLAPKSISWTLPGRGYTPEDLVRFQEAAAAGADASLLELVWSVAADEQPKGGALSLQELTRMMFDSEVAQQQYVAAQMLLADRLYFRQHSKDGLAFEALPEAAVEAARQQLELERQLEEERKGWCQLVESVLEAPRASRPQWDGWKAGPHAGRVEALRELALKGPSNCGDAASRLASESLELLGLLRGREAELAAWELLQDLGLYRLHEPLPLLRLGSSAQALFPEDIEAAAEELLRHPPPDPDASRRQDLTHLAVFCLDDVSTTEVDDGLSVEASPSGRTHLWVHVADPTRFLVSPGGLLDRAARARQRSLYAPFGSVKMFPESLAAGLFSLSSGAGAEPCCALSIRATLDPWGALEDYAVVPSVIRVTHKCSYEEADNMLAHYSSPELLLLHQAALLRRDWRVANGAVEIPLPEAIISVPDLDLDSPNPAVTIRRVSQWESASRGLVGELMVLAGQVAGEVGVVHKLCLPYRSQPPSELPDAALLSGLTPEGAGFALRRCMMRGAMSATPARHSSLGLDAYVQVTSPIRRYSDLVAHFNLKAWLRSEPPPFHVTDVAALATAQDGVQRSQSSAVQEVERYWKAEYFRQNQERSWEASILGPLQRGGSLDNGGLAVVLLEEIGLEMPVKINFPAASGQRLVVACHSVDVASGSVRLVVVGGAGDTAAASGTGSGDSDSSSSASGGSLAAVAAAEVEEQGGAGVEGRREDELGDQDQTGEPSDSDGIPKLAAL